MLLVVLMWLVEKSLSDSFVHPVSILETDNLLGFKHNHVCDLKRTSTKRKERTQRTGQAGESRQSKSSNSLLQSSQFVVTEVCRRIPPDTYLCF